MEEPVKVFQNQFTDSETGTRGNCYAACVATLLGISLEEMPNPDQGSIKYADAIDEIVSNHGYRLIYLPLTSYAADRLGMLLRDTYFIANGLSPRATTRNRIYHSVIHYGGVMWHDPHPSGQGLVEGMVSSVYVLSPKEPWRR